MTSERVDGAKFVWERLVAGKCDVLVCMGGLPVDIEFLNFSISFVHLMSG